ncbi:MAG: ATP-binding protein [Myxococcota bacterium]|nr:ATP-binding protein [Myxococcota bacterium]
MSVSSTLVVRGMNNHQKGITFKVKEPMIVGRSRSCDIFISDVRASRQQARFYRDPSGILYLEDLGSLNGSFVNGLQVTRKKLEDGDIVRLGSTDFEVKALVQRSTVELVEPLVPQHTKLIKQISTVEIPSLGHIDESYISSLATAQEGRQPSISLEEMKAISQKTRNFATLFEISTLTQNASDPDMLLTSSVDILLRALGGDFAYVALLDENHVLVPKVSRSTNTNSNQRFVLSRAVNRYVMEEQCAVIAPDVRNDSRFSGSHSIMMGPTGSIVAAPIIMGSESRGLIALCNEDVRNTLAENDLDLLCVASSIIGPALQSMMLAQERESYLKELEATNTKLVETQEQLIRSERMAAIGRMSSGVIHEVRNHLSPLMLADFVAEQYPEDEDIQEMAELVIEARKRILDLVDEIRMFAHGDHRSYNRQAQGINQVVERVIRFVRCDAKVRKAALETVFDAELIVYIDSDRIRQVLINLIQNAADALADSPEPKISVRVYRKRKVACIAVIDNGIGIPEDIKNRIFDPLFTTKGENGLGLGLDICRRIVEAHEGKLICTSTVGQGTTFTIELPLDPAELFETRL